MHEKDGFPIGSPTTDMMAAPWDASEVGRVPAVLELDAGLDGVRKTENEIRTIRAVRESGDLGRRGATWEQRVMAGRWSEMEQRGLGVRWSEPEIASLAETKSVKGKARMVEIPLGPRSPPKRSLKGEGRRSERFPRVYDCNSGNSLGFF
jgi:hypothetical protein